MKIKRLLCFTLSVSILLSLLVFPAAATSGSFTDITDPDMAEAAEILQVLGVVNGTGGTSFSPNLPLTRAAFCKMALEAEGRGKEANANANRVVFPDVTASHWALGYINAAAKPVSDDSPSLVTGKGDGKFYPDDNITFGEAVTILMRMLGYTDWDMPASTTWYGGYLSTADAVGLTDGVSATGVSAITRGQAAILFANLLFTPMKDSEALYLTKSGGSITENSIVLDLNATADDGTTGSVQTSTGTYKTDRTTFSSQALGVRGALALDKNGKLLGVIPEEDNTVQRVSVLGSVTASAVPVSGGDTLSATLDTVVWKNGEATTYDKIWPDLRTGNSLVFCYNGSGKLDYIYYPSSTATSDNVSVARNKPNGTTNPFSSLTNGVTDYTLYKNGVPATVSDIRQYDVATYDAAAKAMYLSDLRLTGLYENVYPNTATPSTVTVMGKTFPVLSSAVNDLAAFDIGDQITLLLTSDGSGVAGVVSTSAARSTAVGLAQVSDGTATVELLSGNITLSGKTSASTSLDGQLVTVSSSRAGYLSLSALSSSGTSSSLNVAAGTLGTKNLAENVVIYDRAGQGTMISVDLEDITRSTVPASMIDFVSYDFAGNVNYLVLDNATGDGYLYGYFVYNPATSNGLSGMDEVTTPATAAIRSADGAGNETTSTLANCIYSVTNNKAGGLVYTSSGTLAGAITLDSTTVVRSAFDTTAMTVTTNHATYPIAENVQCYNSTTNTWYTPDADGLEQIRGFSDNITIYFDRDPDQGGKVRMVVCR